MTEAERRVRWYRVRAIARAEAGGTSVGVCYVYVGIGDSGAPQLAGMLRENVTVTVIGLRNNRVNLAAAARKSEDDG